MDSLSPQVTQRPLTFENGSALGVTTRWGSGQYPSILTKAGIVGCGIYDVTAEFDQAVSVAKSSPEKPLVNPEDLFEAEISGLNPKAEDLGIEVGMSGREAVELMLKAVKEKE